MPPEEPSSLIAIRFDSEGTILRCRGERVFASDRFLRASWYTTSGATPSNYQPVLGGVAFAYTPSVKNTSEFPDIPPTRRGDRYFWRDWAAADGLMFAMILPAGQSIRNTQPPAVEAKRFEDRIALFWLLCPAKGGDHESVEIEWAFCPLHGELDEEVEALNRRISLSRKRNAATDYDVALSFAGEDRAYVEQVAHELRRSGVSVFYDDFEKHTLWGTNLYDELTKVYEKSARFTVMFISKLYADKRWTNFERQAAQARAYSESREYILPARFDDTELPGLLPTTAYVSLKEMSPADLAGLIVKKLESSSDRNISG
jgi:TIR domain